MIRDRGKLSLKVVYDPATPNTVICVGTLGVVLSVMTRGQKRSKELRHDADLSHQHLPPLLRSTAACLATSTLYY